MEVRILNFGMKPNVPGPYLKGNIELVNDEAQAEYDTKYSSGHATTLNMILLNQLTLADIARLAKNNQTLDIRIGCNIFDEEVTPKNAIAKIDTLTQQELAILTQLAKGKKYREIARMLNLSFDTVKSHAYSSYKKIGINNKLRVGLAFILFRVIKLLQ